MIIRVSPAGVRHLTGGRRWSGFRMIPLLVSAWLGFSLIVSTASAEPPGLTGLWRTVSDVDGRPRALVRLDPSPRGMRGVVAGSLRPEADAETICSRCSGARKDQPLIGMEILWNMHPKQGDPLTYEGGHILDPDTGSVYSARITMSPDGERLTVRGFIGLSVLGRSQVWERVSGPR